MSKVDPLGLDDGDPSGFIPSDPPPDGPLGCYYGVPCSPCDFIICAPEGGGGGGGGNGSGAGGGGAARGGTHGPWPGNQTTGLPQLPTQPLSLGDLLGFLPVAGCSGGFASGFQVPVDPSEVVAGCEEAWAALLRGIAALGVLYEQYHLSKRDIKEFEDAWKKIQQICGRQLDKDQRTRLHDWITKQGIGGYWDIVQEGVTLFCPDKTVPH